MSYRRMGARRPDPGWKRRYVRARRSLLENFVKAANIFQPAGPGMADAHTTLRPSRRLRKVALHERNVCLAIRRGVARQSILPHGEADVIAPAGGINASATDLARWMNVQLARGKLPDGKPLFSLQQAEMMWQPVVVVPPQGPRNVALLKPQMQNYALGWYVETYRGHRIVRHTGAVGGALAALYLIPEKNVGIAVTINSEDGMAMIAVLYHLLDHYLALPPTDWTAVLQKSQAETIAKAQTSLQTLPQADPANGAKPSLALSAYAGKYMDPWYGSMTIRDQGQGKLWISFDRTPGMEGPLEPVAGDKFRTRWTQRSIEDAYLTFAVKDGRVAGATMAAISPLADFSFDYQDLHFVRAASN